MRRLAALTVLFALASCVPPPKVAPTPRPTPTPTPMPSPRPTLSQDWRDWPYTPGDWVYRRDARGSIALFGPAGQDAVFMIRCDRLAGQLYLSRSGAAPAATPMTFLATELSRAVTAQPTGATPPYLAAAIARTDPLLDAIGFSRGRFVVETTGLPTLVIPPWPEYERVVEDCRGF
jgi:hypothetical protein